MKFATRQKVIDLLNSVEATTVRYLSERLGLSKTSILYNLDKMEQAGLAHKGGDFQHRPGNPCKIWYCGAKKQKGKVSKSVQNKIEKQLAELEGSRTAKDFAPRFKSVFVGGKNIWNEVIRR